MVHVTGSEIDNLDEKTAYYLKATIPGGMYKGTNTDTQTFGVGATFVSSTQVSEEAIYNVVKSGIRKY